MSMEYCSLQYLVWKGLFDGKDYWKRTDQLHNARKITSTILSTIPIQTPDAIQNYQPTMYHTGDKWFLHCTKRQKGISY